MQLSRRTIAVGVPAVLVAGVAGASLAAAGSAQRPDPARAAATVRITLKEFKLIPSPSSTGRGRVTFAIRNTGRLTHEFIVLRTSRRASRLPVSGGRAKEIGQVTEAEDIRAGSSRRLSVRLRAGHYVFICNIKGHYTAGQRADFTVR